MNDEAHRFGRRISEARNALGMTQEDLAARLGKGGTVSAIQKWESGQNLPRPGMRARVRVELGMDDEEVETRASWPDNIKAVQETICDLLATMPPNEQRRWRHDIIRRVVGGQRSPAPVPWSDDVEVIADLLGSFLAQED